MCHIGREGSPSERALDPGPHAVPAISRCTHGIFSASSSNPLVGTKNSRNDAAVLEEPALPPIEPFLMSANAESVM